MPNVPFLPVGQELLMCPESTRGTAITTGGILEPCNTVTPSIAGTPYQEVGYMGKSVGHIDSQSTARWWNLAFTTPFRSNGIIFYLCSAMCGTGSDTVTGAGDPYTHTMAPSPTKTVGQTYTMYYATAASDGSSFNAVQIPFGTLSSLHFSASPGAPLMVDAALLGQLLTNPLIAVPTPSVYITDRMTMGYNGTITIPSSTPATAYVCTVTGADFTLSRNVQPITSVQGLSAKDFVPGPIMLSGSFTFEYEGMAALSVYNDFFAQAQQGTSGNPATFKWQDSNPVAGGHSFQMDFYPFLLQDVSLSPNGETMSGTATLDPWNLLADINKGAGAKITSPLDIIIKNNYVTALP